MHASIVAGLPHLMITRFSDATLACLKFGCVLSESSREGTTGELRMKRLVFAIGVLALGFAASTPARADFSAMRFELGYCRIWWNNGINPIGTGWTRVATAPDFIDAQDAAVKKGNCK